MRCACGVCTSACDDTSQLPPDGADDTSAVSTPRCVVFAVACRPSFDVSMGEWLRKGPLPSRSGAKPVGLCRPLSLPRALRRAGAGDMGLVAPTRPVGLCRRRRRSLPRFLAGDGSVVDPLSSLWATSQPPHVALREYSSAWRHTHIHSVCASHSDSPTHRGASCASEAVVAA